MENDFIIEMLGITKEFGKIKANDNITLQLKKGEIHALVGENGAGKSTLMSILFGMYEPSSGEIRKNGIPVKIENPNDANALNIGMVHQHFKLVECFSILDNIILGVEPTKGIFISREEARKKVLEISAKYGLSINPDAIVKDVTVGMQQRAEILKMLYRDNEILIFDEPTAVLTPQEITELMHIMKSLAREGKSILFITHKLYEVFAVSDRVTVIRRGKHVATLNTADTNTEEISSLMVGRQVEFTPHKGDTTPGETILKVEDLSVIDEKTKKTLLDNVSFSVKKGEILGIAGIDGNGQRELIYALTGLAKQSSGKIFLNGKDFSEASIKARNKNGISHIPEDRLKHGLVLDYRLEQNMVLQRYEESEFQTFGFIKDKNVRNYAEALAQKFDVRSSDGVIAKARSMSGGNQQKAIVAREIDRQHDLLIAVQPTRGVDIGAIEFIQNELVKERDNGKGVLLVSLDLDEILALSDRILVIFEGKFVGQFNPKNTTYEELGLYMAGGKRMELSKEVC